MNRLTPVMGCSHPVCLWMKGRSLEVTFHLVPPLKHAAHILVTKLQNICCGKETGVDTSVIHTMMCFRKPTNVFGKSPTRVGAIEDSLCATIKLVPQDGAVIQVACVD